MSVKIVLPEDGDGFYFGGLGVHRKVERDDTETRFSIGDFLYPVQK